MDTQLKQRLVGTAVLFGLAVIFVPMILDGPVERPTSPESAGVPLELPATTAETEPEPTLALSAMGSDPNSGSDPIAESATGGWAVQLGSFSAPANADALAERLKGQGFAAFVQRVDVSNGRMYRVRVGPVADRAEAESLARRVRDRSGEPAVVVEHP